MKTVREYTKQQLKDFSFNHNIRFQDMILFIGNCVLNYGCEENHIMAIDIPRNQYDKDRACVIVSKVEDGVITIVENRLF